LPDPLTSHASGPYYSISEEGWKLRVYIGHVMGAKDVGVEKLKLTCNVFLLGLLGVV